MPVEETMFKATPAQSEYVTRKQLIDKKLKDAGWKVVEFDSSKPLAKFDRCAIEEYPTENGPADYALCFGGQILGVVEGKKLSVGPQEVLRQAERYSRGVMASPFDFRGYKVPFLYSTNGELIRFLDVRHELNISREVARFHTPEALSKFLGRDMEASLARLRTMPNDHPRILARPYQVEANTEIENAIGERKRHMLVAMATGTGKTFMTVNEIYRLMKSGLAKRILFLVDPAFGLKAPLLAINSLRTETEQSEQKGFANLLRGMFGTFRNVTGHAPKITWPISEQNALDMLSLVSYLHRRIDAAADVPRPPGTATF